MTQKSLGFIPLIWECAFCSTRNPGPIKSCTSCGAPQPHDVEFFKVEEEQFNFIKDEALIRMAKAGPDIHCPFCGTRNVATAEFCSKCGGDLSVGGEARPTGERVKTIDEARVEPPAVAPVPKKKRGRLFTVFAVLGLLAVIVGCIFLITLLVRTDTVTASVTDVEWERTLAIEEFTTVTRRDWWDEIPENGEIHSCLQERRYTSNEPEPNATEVCGEPYEIDTGTGFGEVVQDCTYEVYDDYCEYTAMDWVVVETISETGRNIDPYWPDPNLTASQREIQQEEVYTIVFAGGGETYTYKTSDIDLFRMAAPGSRWALEVNQLGSVQSIDPAN